MHFDLIEMTKLPTMPSPWSSADPGETWVIGDFFVTLQKSPIQLHQMVAKQTGQVIQQTPLSYHWAMFVFYHLEKNPVPKSHCPVLCVTLEQVDSSQVPSAFKTSGNQNRPMPVFVGIFKKDTRFNCGEYNGSLDMDTVRNFLFNKIAEEGIVGEPVKIGDLSSAYGHPNTGLPSRDKGSGCGLLCISFLLFFWQMAYFI